MRCLMVTSQTTDVDSLVRAWDCWNATPSFRTTFYHMGNIPQDVHILRDAVAYKPDVIFYIGAAGCPGIPSIKTLKKLRDMAPSINLCCDAIDEPWPSLIKEYAAAGCFDLQVTLDGTRAAPVDLATVTPVDPRPYEGPGPRKDIRCGFSGSVSMPGNWMKRASENNKVRTRIIVGLHEQFLLELRKRTADSTYPDHVAFIRRCRTFINLSFSGSGEQHQVKGHVLETGWAGAALLEYADSPIADWFPEGCWFPFRTIDEAAALIRGLSDAEIEAAALALSTFVRAKYRPESIYGEILSRCGLFPAVAAPVSLRA